MHIRPISPLPREKLPGYSPRNFENPITDCSHVMSSGKGRGSSQILMFDYGGGGGVGVGWRESNEHPFLNSSFHTAKSHSVFFLF